MPNPWEKYGTTQTSKPWEKYSVQTKEPSQLENVSSYASKTDDISTSMPGIATQLTEFVSPPRSANIMGEIEKKRQFLEGAGRKVKGVVQESLGNLSEKGANPYVTGALSAVSELAPFTPSEFALSAGAELLPVAAGMSPFKNRAKGIANRYVNAPKAVRESKLISGEPTVGEDILTEPKIINNDKKVAYEKVREISNGIGNKVQDIIRKITKSGKPETTNVGPFTQPRGNPAIQTREIVSAIDPVLKSVADSSGVNSPRYQSLLKFKEDWMSGKPDYLDFSKANDIRTELGSEVGKGFDKVSDELADKVFAQRLMWGKLRQKLGEISPEMSELLQRQHKLIDISNSLVSDASKGYGEIPKGVIEAVVSPVSKNIKLANNLNRVPEVRGATTQGLSKMIDRHKDKR